MNLGKMRYDEIPIPADLDRVVGGAFRRDRRQRRAKTARRWLTAAAAIFLLFFASANIAPIYAYASGIPVIGTIVQVLRIGTGGEVTDGAHAAADAKYETVDLRFESSAENLHSVPSYTVNHLLAPNRIVMTLSGVRSIDFDSIRESLLSADAVRDVYQTMIGDDSMVGFVIVLESGYDYEITEYADPPRLSLRFYANPSYQKDHVVYYLRSAAMPFGEELGVTAEYFYWDGATQLKTSDGNYIVTVGQYPTLAEANAALRTLEEKFGGDTGLYPASGTADEIPSDNPK